MRRLILVSLIVLACGCAKEQAASPANREPISGSAASSAGDTTPSLGESIEPDPSSDASLAATVDAETVLGDALAAAKANDRRVLVHFGATW